MRWQTSFVSPAIFVGLRLLSTTRLREAMRSSRLLACPITLSRDCSQEAGINSSVGTAYKNCTADAPPRSI